MSFTESLVAFVRRLFVGRATRRRLVRLCNR